MSAPATALKQTPLAAWHRARGGQMVDFAGWDMPVSYSGIVEEHMAVRERAGLFDVSHMGRLVFAGIGAARALQAMCTNDVAALKIGQGQYTLALNAQGGVRDDLIIFRLAAQEYLMIMNAGNRDKITGHFREAVPGAVEFRNRSDEWAMVAFQGPKASSILALLTLEAPAPGRFEIRKLLVGGTECFVSRTGYTGEDGFELYPAAEAVAAVCDALLEAGRKDGALPCGLGARDGLRLEVAYPLYGHEITEETTPWEAGLGWVVKMDKGPFAGRDALAAQKAAGVPRRLIAFTCAGPGVPRQGYPLAVNGEPVGTVTSGTFSPCLKTGIGLGYVPASTAQEAALGVVVRGRALPAVRVKPPFYKAGGVRSVGSAKA